MTGWGQDGPLANEPGHDIDFLAVAGVLAHIGRRGAPPTPPLNLVADFGGGGMLLAFGVVCALHDVARSGRGQVIDAAMVDGAALLMAMMWGHKALGRWHDERGTNIYDSGAPDYDVYETSDGEYVAVGAREPKFFRALLEQLGLAGEELPAQSDPCGWDVLRRRIAEVIAGRTREEWTDALEGAGVCVAPVLRMDEAVQHPQIVARGTLVEHAGIVQPAPAPRYSRTPPRLGSPMPVPGADTDAVLAEWGLSAQEIAALHESGAVRQRA
jgi:alpha-methylacyl-CoA racemase